jgi:23S rRNA (guanosine2251-2'-O)-methyltransferase
VIVYGRNPVREALRAGLRPRRVWASGGAAREPWLSRLQLDVVDAEELARLCGSEAHQGVCAELPAFRYAPEADLLAVPDPLLVALDEVQDPQNLGAIARSAEVAGATGLVILERRSAEVTPAVWKASAGAVAHLPVARVRNLADFLAAAKTAGCWCYGAAAGARARYDQVDLAGGVVLVLGGEGKGLRPRVAKACDELISIPVRGRIDSLNVSAAAAVLLYAAASRRN